MFQQHNRISIGPVREINCHNRVVNGQWSNAYPVITLQNHILSLVPITVLHRGLQISAMVSVEVCEDPVLILQTAMVPYGGSVVLNGREGAGSRALNSEGAGGKVGEGRSRGSRRSRYHGESWPNGCGETRGRKRSGKGSLDGDSLSLSFTGAAIPALAEYPPFARR
jgi:hypothetical protein